jgi:flavin reductase (DIM6/NTAB) family NADH-FMN oxidoreductase RutF
MNPTETHKQLAAALGRVPSGVFILTVRREDQETGMLASWVQQCSFEPPLVSLALKRGRYVADWVERGAAFTLNILDESQTDMIGHFGRGFEAGVPAFEGLEIQRRPALAPLLSEALAYLDCRFVGRSPAGDHDLFICQVAAGGMLGEGRPMVHVRKSGLHY